MRPCLLKLVQWIWRYMTLRFSRRHLSKKHPYGDYGKSFGSTSKFFSDLYSTHQDLSFELCMNSVGQMFLLRLGLGLGLGQSDSLGAPLVAPKIRKWHTLKAATVDRWGYNRCQRYSV